MATINTLYNKENQLTGELERLNVRVEGYKRAVDESRKLISEIKAGETEEAMKKIKEDLDYEAKRQIEKIRRAYNQKPDVMFLAGCVDEILTVLEKHKYVGSTDGIIMKTLECASYQKWQETKAEAWGRNNK